jgi:hypothetical protein
MRVFTCVKHTKPMPHRWARMQWCWGVVIREDAVERKRFRRQADRVSIRIEDGPYAGTEATPRLSDCYVWSSTKWYRVCVAGHALAPGFWWWHGDETKCFRLATQLEVILYEQGFVPHPRWRLLDDLKEFVGSEPHEEKIYLARQEKQTDEEWADEIERKRTKRRVKALTHAKKMLLVWEAKLRVVEGRYEKWCAAVKRMEKKVQPRE